MIPRLVFPLAAFLLILSPLVLAQREAVPVAPPQPVALAAKVRREGKTEIPLRIYGQAHELLKYLIRNPPEHGRLSEPQQKDRETAVVIYEPPADLGIITDKFSYAVQNSAGVSAAVEISLTIVDQPPQLAITDSLEFPSVRAGETNSQLLELTNQGGLIATGEVVVSEPWKIEGKTGYRLRSGDVAVFKVIFAPTAGGDFDGFARYTSDPEHSTRLHAIAIAPLAVDPPEVVLQLTPGDVTRGGSFTVTNQTEEARTVKIKADPRLMATPSEIQIPPNGKTSVSLQTKPTDVQALKTELQLESGDLVLRVPIQAAGLGPIMRIAQKSISFGQLSAAHPMSAQFDLENVGSSPGEISWQIGPPFSTELKSAILSPGEKKGYALQIDTKESGKFRGWLHFQSTTQSFDLPVDGEVATGPARRGVIGTGSLVAAEGDKKPGPATADEPPAPPGLVIPFDWVADIPAPAAVKTTLKTPTTAVVEWPAKLSPVTKFRLEMRQLTKDKEGKTDVIWLAPTDIPIVRDGDVYKATMEGLDPGQEWTVRVLPIGPSGEAGSRLFAIDFYTPLAEPITEKIPWMQGLFLILAGLLVWQGWTRWQRRTTW